jgi:hypothetical protein
MQSEQGPPGVIQVFVLFLSRSRRFKQEITSIARSCSKRKGCSTNRLETCCESRSMGGGVTMTIDDDRNVKPSGTYLYGEVW